MGIAVVAVGLFALPSTVSLFSGQHTWYALDDSNLMPCKKCHADVYEELCASGFHKWDGGNFSQGGDSGDTPSDFACYGCHRANASITYAAVGTSAAAVTPGKQAHAASTVACMLCHQYNASQAVSDDTSAGTGSNASALSGFFAGGFSDPYTGTGPYNYTGGGSTGEHAAHQRFIETAINWTKMEDANEACIACHTHVPVNITWKHAHDLNFTATWKDSGWVGTDEFPPTHFNVSDWGVNGTMINYSYGYGNGTGSTNSSGWYKGV
mgnify:FL=1